MKMILFPTAAALALAAPAEAAPKPRVAPFERPFSVAMMVGDPEQVVAANGSLELAAECVPNDVQARLRLNMRSTVDGWGTTWAGHDLPAGFANFIQVSNAFPEFASTPGANFIAVSPDGSYLAVGSDTLAFGVNVFGSDCFAAGVVTRFKVPLAP
jgi:hypothetical protein